MSSLIEHVERAEIARWEAVLNEEPKCEHSYHGRDDCHDDGPATHYQRGRGCSHCNGLRCATWAAFASAFPHLIKDCPTCGLPFDSIFIEL